MPAKNIEEKVRNVFLKVFPEVKEGNFDLKKTQDTFQGWDSFSHMELVANLEKEFEISLEMDEIVSARSAHDFVGIIKKKVKL